MDSSQISIKMKKFKRNEGLDAFDIRRREAVCSEIHKSLQDYYPNCEFFIYGSTLNGYGTKISDLDLLFMPFPAYESEDSECEEVDFNKCPSVNDIKTEKISKESLLKMNKTLQLAFVKKVLRKLKAYQNLMLIQCRCPIINFNIPKLGITSDISCGSKQVVYNTKLFQLFNQIDERVQDLIMYLRHWAKSVSVIKSGILSSYAFSLLVIYFLQNRNPPVLPNVMHLIENSDSFEMIDGWKVAFIEDANKIEKSLNSESCGKLLTEFFSFYWKFDFSKVISVYYGKSLSIEELSQTDDGRIKEFEVTPLSVQDPFILSFNVCRNLKVSTLSSFKQKLYVAKKILQEDDTSKNHQLLFDERTYKKRMNELFCPPIPNKAMSCCVGFDTVLRNVSRSQKEAYYLKICTDLLDLLQYGLLIECEVINKKNFIDNGSLKQEKFELLMSVQCALFNRTYVGRSKVKEIPATNCDSEQFNNSIVREEFVISNYLIQTNSLLSSPGPFFWFICDCYKSNLDQVEDIAITFIPLTEFKECKSFFQFLNKFLSTKLLNMLLDSEKPDLLTTKT